MKNINPKLLNLLYVIAIGLCFLPFVSSAMALLIGIGFSLIGLPNKLFSKHKSTALQVAIVLMGFGMNLDQVIETSKTGFFITVISVSATFALGILLGKLLKIDQKLSILITSGTAICGGSAIAAISPIIDAEDNQISFSLVVVFMLNALALFIFPSIGNYFDMSQEAFGQWAAVAIHDTSSVVGASAVYGEKALEIATIIKLTRALWIIPLSLFIAFTFSRGKDSKISIPWFILYFIIAIIFAYYLPQVLPDFSSQFSEIFAILAKAGKKIMLVALFLIGTTLSISEVKKIGPKSFIQGIVLWVVVTVSSLLFFM